MSTVPSPSDPAVPSLRDRTARLLQELFGVPREALDDHVELADGLQLDSLSLVELTVALEDVLGVDLQERPDVQVTTFGDLLALLARAQAEQQEARSA